MAQAYIRDPRSNLVVSVDAIKAIMPVINPDNSYSYKYAADPQGSQMIFLSVQTFPTALEAIQAGYNNLVIELP